MPLQEMEARVKAWVDTPEGSFALMQMFRHAREASDRVLRDARVTPAQMREPVTI